MSRIFIIFSIILENIDRRLIGLKLSSFKEDVFLRIGTTMLSFNFSGKIPLQKLKFIIWVKTVEMSCDIFLINSTFKQSKPEDFLFFKLFITDCTSLSVVGAMKNELTLFVDKRRAS